MPERESLVQILRGSGLDSASGAEFIQHRIALFAKLVFIMVSCFLIAGNGLAIALHGESIRSIFAHRGGSAPPRTWWTTPASSAWTSVTATPRSCPRSAI